MRFAAPRPRYRTRTGQDGYALMMVVFFMALLLVGTLEIAPRVLTEGRRQKEEEMIWRGKQYTRGIKMYYRKLGRFPNSVDDLTKPKIGNLRFMRQAYKDPMNKEDGAWRLIYVGPAGQLIGSLKPPTSIQTNGLPGPTAGTTGSAFGGIGSTPPTTGIGTTTTGTSAFGSTGFGFGTDSNSTGTSASGAAGATGTGTAAPGAPGGILGTDPSQIPAGDTPTLVGGNIIGIGSKVNHASIIVYEQAANYRLFEFIWNPAKDLGAAMGLPGQGTPGQGTGQGGFGVNPSGPGTANQLNGGPGQVVPGQGQPPTTPTQPPNQNQ
jgi:hypothetical protein